MLQHACRSFFEQEVMLASTAPAGWMQGVDQALRNQVLPCSQLTNGCNNVYQSLFPRDT